MHSAIVSTRGARRWDAGHPWIYRSDVITAPDTDAGAVRVIGTDEAVVRDAVLELLDDPDGLRAMAAAGAGLYGDGHSAARIVQRLGAG